MGSGNDGLRVWTGAGRAGVVRRRRRTVMDVGACIIMFAFCRFLFAFFF